jgi:hypothetical protein
MPLKVIGAGVGRTGTYSLMLALNQLGLGPCHHMVEVSQNLPTHLPMWVAALNGHPDWPEIYKGYESAVDWPTAGFVRELRAAYPSAKFVLTDRSPESWAQSFSETIYKLLAGKDQAPPEIRPWLEMVIGVVAKTGFPAGLDVAGLMRRYTAHTDAVKAAVPADQLLIYQVKDGWGPLCAFLGVPVPAEQFPRTNDRAEFWDRISSKISDKKRTV